MSMKVYLDAMESKPFEIEFRSRIYRFPNFNALSWRNIDIILERTLKVDFDYLLEWLPRRVLDKITYNERVELVRAWCFDAGINLSHLIWFREALENYDTELNYDLATLTNINSLEELFKMKPIHVMDIVFSIAGNNLNSLFASKIHGKDKPFSQEAWLLAAILSSWTGKMTKMIPSDTNDGDIVSKIMKESSDENVSVGYDKLIELAGDLTKNTPKDNENGDK